MRNALQDLLDHPFLRPTEGPAGPAPGQVGLTRDQLKKLLTQVGTPQGPMAQSVIHFACLDGPPSCQQSLLQDIACMPDINSTASMRQ